MKEKLKQLFGLFGAFAVVGVTTFGGGYAMLPALQREVVEKRRWATEEEVMDWYAIGQCTPGVIAVNTSTFIGYRLRGVPGAIRPPPARRLAAQELSAHGDLLLQKPRVGGHGRVA